MKTLLAAMCALGMLEVARAYEAGGRRPDTYAIIFNAGYGGDYLPKERDKFEALVRACKEAGFNTIMTKYADERAEILKKHGMKFMVDLLAPGNHVYKDAAAAEALCRKLSGSDVVYAYHLWSDRMGSQVAGRSRDLANLKTWDPNHPTYLGDYKAESIGGLEAPDIIGYYDFHWKRGGFYRHLQRALDAARKHDVPFLVYADASPGQPGIGNFNRVMYTVAQSTVFGMRGYLFHYTGAAQMNLETAMLGAVGKDCARVNGEIAPLGPELMKLGNPDGVYSTPVTRNENNNPLPAPALPEGLPPLPDGFWIKAVSGEVLIGEYRQSAKAGGAPVLLVANHNAYVEQPRVALKPGQAFRKISRFDRRTGAWAEVSASGGVVAFAVPPAGLEMLKFEK